MKQIFYGLTNETYETYEELIQHYRPICEALRSIYDHLNSLPKDDDFWTTSLKNSFVEVLDYIGGNTENDDMIPR